MYQIEESLPTTDTHGDAWPDTNILLQIINTYTEAVQTVDAKIATGKPHTLWVEFAKFYETAGQLDDARVILEKSVLVGYKYVDDLAAVWCEWAEMELRHE